MLRHLGYVAMALTIDSATNRTCRLRNATPERLRALIGENLAELERVLRFNVEHDIRLYRVSSQVIPFASHAVNGIAWWDEFAADFARMAALIRENDLRVSMHPGQFTVLNSPNPWVVAASMAEIEWHVRLLDALGADGAGKVVIHGGGIYGDKAEAMDRFVTIAEGLPEAWRRRLVIENDERLFSAEDVLDLSARTGLPVVFDWLHHAVHSGGDPDASGVIARCFATWGPADGPPKVHLSSQAPDGRPGAHGDWVDPADCDAFLAACPPDVPFDCMLEAKQKDRALFRLREHLATRGIEEGDPAPAASGWR